MNSYMENDQLELEQIKWLLENIYLLKDDLDCKDKQPSIDNIFNTIFEACKDIIPKKNFFGYDFLTNHEFIYAIKEEELKQNLKLEFVFLTWLNLKISTCTEYTSLSKLFKDYSKKVYKDEIDERRRKDHKQMNDKARKQFKNNEDYDYYFDGFVDDRKANFSKKLRELFINTPIPKLLNIKKGNKEYEIPKIYEKIAFAIIKNAQLNPFYSYKNNVKIIYSKSKRFITKVYNDLSKMDMNYEEEIISSYVFEKIFHFKLIYEIAEILSYSSVDLNMNIHSLSDKFSYLSLFPNVKGRLNYLSYISHSKNFDNLTSNLWDYQAIMFGDKPLAMAGESKTRHKEDDCYLWVELCDKFIFYMFSYFMPIVKNYFHYLFTSSYKKLSNDDIIDKLYEYIVDNKIYEGFTVNLKDRPLCYDTIAYSIYELNSDSKRINKILNSSKLKLSLASNNKEEMLWMIGNLKTDMGMKSKCK